MKPNGRRAWRKSCKFMRKSEGSAYPADVARRNRKRPGFCDDQRPSIAKPFIPRSLVGMTQGARKRRARKEVGELGHMLYADYRIGQRLRPCPGCSLCKGVGCYACYPKFDQDCDACVNGMSCLCDGSGVLPARKAVDTATCEGFDGPCNAADAELRSSRTMYHWDGTGENPNRPRMLCDECYRSYTAYWDEMWAQVNGEWPRVRSTP